MVAVVAKLAPQPKPTLQFDPAITQIFFRGKPVVWDDHTADVRWIYKGHLSNFEAWQKRNPRAAIRLTD